MEEENVEVMVQEEEVEDKERQWREQSEDRRENRQSLKRMTHGWDDAHKHLSQCRGRQYHECGQTRGNVTCEGVLFKHPRRLQQIAISCKRTDYNSFFYLATTN